MNKFFKLFIFVVATTLLVSCGSSSKPKYVFYFIGDGMGLSVINTTEHYMGAQRGLGFINDSLTFTLFPVTGFATTSCTNQYITDSAAAGTALACGEKTSSGTIGMNSDHTKPLESIAIKAKKKGMGVAVVTTVSIDHATPASFYAHQPSRGQYYDIAMEGAVSDFDFFAGSGFLDVDGDKGNVLEAYEKSGYTILKGKNNLGAIDTLDSKVLLIERDGASKSQLSYAVDRSENDLSLSDIVSKATDYLYRKYKKEGFVIMAEGGAIDWAAHDNDVIAALGEVKDLSSAVSVALEFYNKHPEETLIIVTADHETGGMSCGRGSTGYNMYIDKIAPSFVSYGKFVSKYNKADISDFDQLKSYLTAELNFWDRISIDTKEEESLKEAFENNPASIPSLCYSLVSKKCGVGWTSGTHTGVPVMIFAKGAGDVNFGGRKDNTQIPQTIGRLLNIWE